MKHVQVYQLSWGFGFIAHHHGTRRSGKPAHTMPEEAAVDGARRCTQHGCQTCRPQALLETPFHQLFHLSLCKPVSHLVRPGGAVPKTLFTLGEIPFPPPIEDSSTDPIPPREDAHWFTLTMFLHHPLPCVRGELCVRMHPVTLLSATGRFILPVQYTEGVLATSCYSRGVPQFHLRPPLPCEG